MNNSITLENTKLTCIREEGRTKYLVDGNPIDFFTATPEQHKVLKSLFSQYETITIRNIRMSYRFKELKNLKTNQLAILKTFQVTIIEI